MSMEGWATTHTSNGHEHDTNVPGLEDHEHEGTCNDPCELVFLEDHEHEGTGNDPCEPGLHEHEHETLGHSLTDNEHEWEGQHHTRTS